MHAKIFQMNIRPFKEEDLAEPSDFYENASTFADYIGDAVTDLEAKKKCIQSMVNDFCPVFDFVPNKLMYMGLDNFTAHWYGAMKEQMKTIGKDYKNIFRESSRLRRVINETHKLIEDRFYVSWYSMDTLSAKDFLEFCYDNLRVGNCLYVGSIIDFHL